MKLEPGDPGQFDVIVDGEVIATRSRSPLKRLLGGGWPEGEAVIAEIRKRHGG